MLDDVDSFPPHFSQISFQEFKNKLLEPGLVDRIVVSNKSVAKVYVRSSPKNNNQTQENDIDRTTSNVPVGQNTSQYRYYFNIGSVESFEEKLEEAQEALGIDPHDYVPVTYHSEVIWYQELMKYAPTMLLVGLIYLFGRRMQGGFNIGAGPGRGSRGIFNIGKAHVTKLDKNSKNKVCYSLYILHFSSLAYLILFLFVTAKSLTKRLCRFVLPVQFIKSWDIWNTTVSHVHWK